jgi:hypothetical protein
VPSAALKTKAVNLQLMKLNSTVTLIMLEYVDVEYKYEAKRKKGLKPPQKEKERKRRNVKDGGGNLFDRLPLKKKKFEI